jgi:hypothetical protein
MLFRLYGNGDRWVLLINQHFYGLFMKKTFLTSVALLAATLAVDASAALPESVSAKLPEIARIVHILRTLHRDIK